MTNENKKDMILITNDSESEKKEKEEFIRAVEDETDEQASPKSEKQDDENSKTGLLGKIIAVMTVVIMLLVGFIWWKFVGGTETADNQPLDAKTFMKEKYAPPLKAKTLNPTKIYQLRSTADSFNGLTIAVTKIQFRQDATRMWVKIDNDSGQTISMIPSANSKLIDDQGRIYKNDPFGGEQISAIAPGTHEEILLTYDPIRQDAKSLTFNLDSVFDIKHTAWNYAVQFDIP